MTPPDPAALRPARRKRVLRWGFGAVAVVLLGVALSRQWEDFVAAVRAVSLGSVVASFLVGSLALVANAMSWRAAMTAVGADLPVLPAVRTFLVSQLGKYVPGSVWPVLAQVELARDHGHSRTRGATGSLLAMIVGVVTSSVVAAALLVLPDARTREAYWWVLLAVPVAAAVLWPPVLRRVLALAPRILRRDLPVPDVAGAAMAVSIGWSLAMWCLFGLHAWSLGRDLAPDPTGVGLLVVTGAFALAWVTGFLVVIAPAGLGAREAALVLALGGVLTRPDALALALISRVLLSLADAVGAGIGMAFLRPARRRATPSGRGTG